MPRLTESQILGDLGERWFPSLLPKGWLFQRPSTDVGVDGVVVVCEEGLDGLEFRVQIKACAQLKQSRSGISISGVKLQTIRYWFTSPIPLLIVVFDASTRSTYYGWHFDMISDPHAILRSDKKTVSIKLSSEKCINDDAWLEIKTEIRDYYRSLLFSIEVSHADGIVLAFVGRIIEAIRMLLFAQNARIWKDNVPAATAAKVDMLLLQADVHAHVNALKELKALLDLPMSDNLRKKITAFRDAYLVEMSESIKGFDNIGQNKLDSKMQINVTRLKLIRPRIMDSLLELIGLLAKANRKVEQQETSL